MLISLTLKIERADIADTANSWSDWDRADTANGAPDFDTADTVDALELTVLLYDSPIYKIQ